MGKPAARCTDMVNTCNDPADLPTCQIVAMGTVLINNLPAAKQGDQVVGVDTHIIMIPSPGGPIPTPLPHPYSGQLMNGLSSSVFIEGLPAAIQGSKSMNMPPHIPQGGPFQKPPSNEGEVMLGSPDVQFGNGGGGGGAGGGGGDSAQGTGAGPSETEGHSLDVKFVDKGGKPITGAKYKVKGPDGKTSEGALTGQVQQSSSTDGDHEITISAITKAEWSAKSAHDGETVKMKMEGTGFPDSAKASFEVWEKDMNRADKQITVVGDIDISGDKAEADWQYVYENEEEAPDQRQEGQKYSEPSYYFIVKAGGLQARSSILEYKDFIEVRLKDHQGQAAADAPYRAFLPNGEVKRGNLDSDGYKKIENVPPGRWRVEFPDHGISEEGQSGGEQQGQ